MYIHGTLRLYATWSVRSRGESYLDMTGACQGRKQYLAIDISPGPSMGGGETFILFSRYACMFLSYIVSFS